MALGALVALVIVAAGCGSSSVTPAPSSIAVTPSAGASVAAASHSPSPTRSADPAAVAVTRFVALVTKKDFSYQATFSGQSRATVTILPIRKGLLEVSGADVLVRATWVEPGHSYVVEHRYVGGKAWLRFDVSLPWNRLVFSPTDSMAAFAAVRTTADVADLEPVSVGGQILYKVSIRSGILNPVMIPSRNLTEAAVTSPKLMLLLDANGRPVSGTATIDGRGRVSGQLQEIVIDLNVTFSRLGQPVTIAAP